MRRRDEDIIALKRATRGPEQTENILSSEAHDEQ
jgi:hypothetical protein